MKALIDLLMSHYGLPPDAAAATANRIMVKKKAPAKEAKSFDPEAGPYNAGIQAINSVPAGWEGFKYGALRGLQKPQPPGVMAPVPVPTLPQGLNLPPGTPMGMSESGQAVDVRGAKLGPMVDPNVRNLVHDSRDVNMQDQDFFTQKQLEMMYGEDLRALEENRGAYPPGYFDGAKPGVKENRKQGVQELKRREKGIKT